QLREMWRDGAEAYLGITGSGVPNFFMLYGPNTNLGGNSIIYMLEGQISYVRGALRALDEQGLDWLDVRPQTPEAVKTRGAAAHPHSGVGDGVPHLVHPGLGPQHQQLARPDLPLPVPRPPVRPRQLPAHPAC